MIVCIVGPSGSGKTHLATYLEDKYGIPMIESRTTRKRRSPNESGHTFVSDEEFDTYLKEDMLAYTEWEQEDGFLARYCCLKKDVSSKIVSYVIDEYGLEYLKKNFHENYVIFAVRMFADEHRLSQVVSKERRRRDKGKFNLSDEHFDYFIDNDYSDSMPTKYDNLYKKITNEC